MDADDLSRRQLLSLAGVATTTSLGGCASLVSRAESDGPPTTGGPTAGGTTTDATPTGGTTTDRATDAARETAEPPTVTEPNFGVSEATVPNRGAETRYATMGTTAETVTLYGNWKCPYTREFVAGQMGTLVDDFVAPGEVTLEYRAVAYENGEPSLGPDAPRATRAGLAVWDVDPDAYWSYFAHVFENQPQDADVWATTDTLVRFARAADVDGVAQVRKAIQSKSYTLPLQATADRAPRVGVTTFPRVVYDDTVTAPTLNPEATRRQFERAADSD
ncbi:DsbA family protein [Salinirubrum litoreum]|uniref:DsbA family protein n=1 Tax=Salinirubrum litoreum TaxID=1126234 RepID=A0ABD5RCT8_9EURY|nr:thioredoxin domain-containing protein [Salinirubrum litoreum]